MTLGRKQKESAIQRPQTRDDTGLYSKWMYARICTKRLKEAVTQNGAL